MIMYYFLEWAPHRLPWIVLFLVNIVKVINNLSI